MRKTNEYIILGALLGLTGLAHAADIRVNGKFVSEATSGPPLVVNSSDKVTGLNVDKLDGFDVGDFATPGSGAGVHWKNLEGVPGEEIDQDCAEFTGCFIGDSGGFPVTISKPGSYRLAGNLDVSGLSDTDVIQIQVSNVTLDLNGFAITGPVSCTDTPVTSCTPGSGNGSGVIVAESLTGIAIANGSVRGLWNLGVYCQSPCRMKGLSVSENRTFGIAASNAVPGNAGNALRDCIAARNGQMGVIVVGNVDKCHSYGNASNGIQVTGTVSNSRSVSNGVNGIRLNFGTAQGNTASGNTEDGISGTGTARNNTTSSNGEHGISISGPAIGNYSSFNTGDGLRIFGSAVNNTAEDNDGDGIAGTGLMTGNKIRSNQGDGIKTLTGGGSKISGNAITGNQEDGIECAEHCLILDNLIQDNLGPALNSVSGLLVWGRNFIRNNAGTGSSVVGTTLSHGDNVCTNSTC